MILSPALTISAATAEALAIAPWISWITHLFWGPTVVPPNWLTLTLAGLLAFTFARLVLNRHPSLLRMRLFATGGWLAWTSLWWLVRESLSGDPSAIRTDFTSHGLSLVLASALAWWRALALASEPTPFQGNYLRWAVVRDSTALTGISIVAGLTGGELAQSIWAQLAWITPLLLVTRLLTAALVQVEAIRLAYPGSLLIGQTIVPALVIIGSIVLIGAMLSFLAGPAAWNRLTLPVLWFLTLVVAVLVTFTVALALLVWYGILFLAWIVRNFSQPSDAGSPPAAPNLPDFLRPYELPSQLPLPAWLVESLAVLLGLLLCFVLARIIAHAFRRSRMSQQSLPIVEQREAIRSSSWQNLRLRTFLPQLPRFAPRLSRRDTRPHDVRSAYRATLVLLARHGLPRRGSQTPLEVEREVTLAFPSIATPLRELTHRYLLTRYAEIEGQEDRRAALAAWQALAERFRSELAAHPVPTKDRLANPPDPQVLPKGEGDHR